ncbi:flagellar hook-associated protein FlgK [Phenylobacterium sp. J426]|uniref:flagellar hook-associated protein FlgK n=1 Tax=Phenylobacterium sp. J426 TaxID=2898439 RepID=UPI002151BE52|nr:flagellar hook-associated protein FlgK [Phenylobacterium sp. J426]MCR5874746.1 flagellar hook-associated protein FlgK [Phenylobacterium sp. J426]
MSLNVTLQTASSGLNAAQAALRAVSDNIANVNTPGYVRKAVDQQPLVVDGVGMGVRVQGVKRITDDYLQMASLTAASDSSRWAMVSQYLDNAQSLFGNPSSDTFFFNRLDAIYGAFATAADDPSSSLLRSQALSNVQDFLAEADRINVQLKELGGTIETKIIADIDRANSLLTQINQLNVEIGRAKLVNADASGSENIQSQLLDELSTLMNVRIIQRDSGGVTVRSNEGVLLAGDGVAAKLAYVRSDTTPGYITAQPSAGSAAQPIQIASGELRGLMDLRDVELPQLSDQMGEFLTRAADRINAAHNASVAYPAPNSLTGRNTGLDLPTAVSGFSGQTTIAVMGATGVLARRVDIDFTAGTMSANGGPAVAFTPATFLATLNGELSGQATVAFTNGTMSLTGNGTNTVAVDEGTSMKSGRAFSHFFGLNDLIRSNGFTNYDTGLTGTDAHGFTAGQQISLRLSSPEGLPLRDVAVTVPAGATMNDLLAALNNTTSGVGLYGSFSLDARGNLTFQGAPPTDAKLSVITDNTERGGAGGPSISQLFGLGGLERASRASRFRVDTTLDSDPTRLAFGRLDFSGGFTQPLIRPGDGRGALALSQAGDVPTGFQAAGSLGDVTMTVSRYASEFGGSIGRKAAAAETRKESAAAVMTEATARRQSVEGVNLDEELVNMTTYQQAFNASARVIQAAKDLYDVLLGMV